MKKIIYFLSFLLTAPSFGQIADWYKVDLSRFGYKRSTFTFEEVPIYQEWQKQTDSLNTLKAIKGGSLELSLDIYTKHIYFSLDASTLIDVGVTLFQFDKSKERWWNNNTYYVDRSDIFPTRLAFGTNITKYFAVYAGGQYALSSIGLRYKQSASPLQNTLISGNVYGFGGHVVGALSFMNVRYSYMYNWISQARTFKGNSITNELVLSMGFANVGIFAKVMHVYNESDAGYLPVDRSKIFVSKYDNAKRTWQSAQYATQFQFSVGIYAAGLFSKITKAGSNALFETEQGTYRERQIEKRTRVIYKE